MDTYVIAASQDYYCDKEEVVFDNLFRQYEKVIVQSIITSFGLDFIVKDHFGGNVDTIHNARKGFYQKAENRQAYENRGIYNAAEYHSDPRYIQKNRENSILRKDGKLQDAYTGKRFAPNDRVDLDHVISASEIHNDPGRVLSGLRGVDLANSDSNLKPTNPHTNRTKKASSMPSFLQKHGHEYTEKQKDNMLQINSESRKEYEYKVAAEYYTCSHFANDVASAARKVGIKMGLRELLGFVFTEIWFSIKDEFKKQDKKTGKDIDMKALFKSIGNGVKNGFESAKKKYKELFSQFVKGAAAGFLSSLTTTVCNIFFTTAKDVVRIIRQAYASVIEAGKILLFNPENYPFGERMRAAAKVIATGASIVAGIIVGEVISKTPIVAYPVVGEIVPTFCGTFCTGILSCTLLYYLDRSKAINSVVSKLDKIHSIEDDIHFFKKQADLFEKYAAELMKIDLIKFKREIAEYETISQTISCASSSKDLNRVLKNSFQILGIETSWEQTHKSFDAFMKDKNKKLIIN